MKDGVVDTLREVLTAQAPYWRSLQSAILPVPAEVAWLAHKKDEENVEEKLEGLTISMSRAELKASGPSQLPPSSVREPPSVSATDCVISTAAGLPAAQTALQPVLAIAEQPSASS